MDGEALGHDLINHEAQAVTCTDSGWNAYSNCERCDYTTFIEIPAIGHKYENKICTICGELKSSKDLEYTLSDTGEYYIVSGIGTCTDLDIVIPAKYDNLPVTTIGAKAFYNCSNITSITIPEGVTVINTYAFYNCSNLTSITLPNSLSTIDTFAISYCSALKSITIPKQVTSLEKGAFHSCTSLEEIHFDAVAMNNLNSYNYVFQNAGKNSDGIKVLVDKDVTRIPANLFNPESTSSFATNIISVEFEEDSICTLIGNYAFVCCNITSITIPNTIRTIGSCAFYNCNKLTSITIPENVTSMGSNAFYNSIALEEVYFNAKAMSDLNDYNNVFYCAGDRSSGIKLIVGEQVTKIPAYLFCPYTSNKYGPNLVSIEFAENSVCESIGKYAFFNCQKMTALTLPNSVVTVELGAFNSCTSLEMVTMSSGITTIKSYAFSGCSSLKDVYYSGSEEDWATINIHSTNTSLTVATKHYNTAS